MPAVKRSVSVKSEVILRNPLHAGDKEWKRGIPSFETHGRGNQKPKTGVSVALKNRLMSSKLFLNKR